MIARAMGAAVAPRPGLIGEGNGDGDPRVVGGSEAMNQVSFSPGLPVSAVPVLPATGLPGSGPPSRFPTRRRAASSP